MGSGKATSRSRLRSPIQLGRLGVRFDKIDPQVAFTPQLFGSKRRICGMVDATAFNTRSS
jgi:predicted N-formylglutamate amidohydrolase